MQAVFQGENQYRKNTVQLCWVDFSTVLRTLRVLVIL